MSDMKRIDIRDPKADGIFNAIESFDNSLVVMDNPDDATVQQYGNGTTLVSNENPDDLEDKLVGQNKVKR